MLRGLTTVNFWAADMAAAKKWYTELLGFGPYFERPLASNPHSMPSGASATTSTNWV
jgi:catechol 2,3-dioxygenase-like lactoylglutathione lyase family enzyme